MPIFIAWTRSFWFGIVPALLSLLDLTVLVFTDATIGPIAGLLVTAFGWDQVAVENIMRGVATIAGLIIAYQRRGPARPYTLDPRAIR